VWEKITQRAGYVKGAVNQGVIVGETGAILIDTGLDRQAARKIIRLLEELSLTLSAIINTHAHADHFGGNQELINSYGGQVKVYAPIFEETSIRHPIWEPIYLYGGAVPFSDLQNKFLLAPPSPVDVIFEAGPLRVDGVELEAVPLFGHSYRQMGIAVNHILFSADAFFGNEVLDKHPIPFHVDTEETLQTLEKIVRMPYQYFIPGHGSMIATSEELVSTLSNNRFIYDRVMEKVIDTLKIPHTAEQLISTVCSMLGIEIRNTGSYLLYSTAIKAILKYLLARGEIVQGIQENQWIWETKNS